MVGDTSQQKSKKQRGVVCNPVIPAHASWREDGEFKTRQSYVETLSQKRKKARTLNVHVKDLAPRAERWLQKRVFKKYLMLLKED